MDVEEVLRVLSVIRLVSVEAISDIFTNDLGESTEYCVGEMLSSLLPNSGDSIWFDKDCVCVCACVISVAIGGKVKFAGLNISKDPNSSFKSVIKVVAPSNNEFSKSNCVVCNGIAEGT